MLTIEECASVPTTTRQPPARGRSPSRCLAVSRATASADRLPAEPPETKHPPGAGRQPGLVGDQPEHRVLRAIAPEASSQEMPWMEAQETSMSNSRLALVGAAGMKPRNRGLSAEMTLGAITEA